MMEEKTIDQAGCFENTRNFPSEEIPLGYRLRSGSDFDIMLRIGLDFISEHHFMIKSDPSSALLTVFSITQPDLCLFPGDASSAK